MFTCFLLRERENLSQLNEIRTKRNLCVSNKGPQEVKTLKIFKFHKKRHNRHTGCLNVGLIKNAFYVKFKLKVCYNLTFDYTKI